MNGIVRAIRGPAGGRARWGEYTPPTRSINPPGDSRPPPINQPPSPRYYSVFFPAPGRIGGHNTPHIESVIVDMKLLIIEDEKKVAKFIEQGLREEHYEVECAYDGEQGLEKALSGEFDGIVLDLMMPKRDGISLLREFRARGMTTPVLILTAKGTIQDKITG